MIRASIFDPPWQTIDEDGSPFLPETYPATVSLETGRSCSDVVMGFYRPNGDLVWLSIATEPLFKADRDKPYGVEVIFRDISEQVSKRISTRIFPQKRSPSIEPLVATQAIKILTVMLVEDSPEDRELYRRYLKSDRDYQYNFVEAESGEEALEINRQYQPDIILLDYLLPDFNGLEWLSLWRRQNRNNPPPVIVLTGQGDETIAVQFIKQGAANYLVKGQLTANKLKLEVKRAIAEHQLDLKHQATLIELGFQEERLNLATVAAGLGMWFWDLTTNCLEWTQQCKTLFGLTADTEMSYEVFLKALHPEDRDRTNAAVEQALATKTEFNLEYRTIWADGSVHWILAQGKGFYNTDGEPVGMMGTTQDISDRKLIEAQLVTTKNTLESVIRDTNDAIYVKDIEGRYVIINQAAVDWLGMTIEEVIGRDDTALFDSDTARSIKKTDRQVIESNQSLILEEETTSRTQQRTFLSSKYPWYDATGNIAGIIGISKDITELKESQQKVQEKEQLLRLALSSASAASWNWDLTTGKVTWSQENFDLYGLDPEIEPRYEIWEDLVHPDDREWASREIERVIADPTSGLKIEFRIIHSQKGIRWILATGHVTYNDNGEPIYFSGIDLDISDRKKAEQKIQRSEQHLRRVLDSLYSFIGVLTPDGILLEVNRTALEAANLQPEDVLGKPFDQAYWWSYSTASQARLNAALEGAKTGEAVRYDVEVRLSEENYTIIDFALVPLFDAHGEVEYIIPSGIDISDREKSKKALEQREYELRMITEAIPQQIWTGLPNGETDYFNQRWQDYTGLTVEQANHRGWEYMIHPDDLAEVSQMWHRCLTTGCNYDLKTRLRRADGEFEWFLVRGTPLRNESGEIVKWYGTNTNIQQIKELEAKLQQQTEDLIQANQLKDEFLAIVSHELRTPLNPILGWSQLLAGGRLDPNKTAQGLSIIGRNAKLQAQLIDDLLDVSRILRGKLNLKKDHLNLEFVIRSAISTVQLAAEAKSIQIETTLEPNIGQVLGDAGRLQQIVWNLVSNAIKFTPEGGKVEIKLSSVTSHSSLAEKSRTNDRGQMTKDKFALIQIIDTGQGIEPEFLPYVFDRFRQAEASSTREFGGLGLGLAIVKHLTELHGGTVAAQSLGEGQGSTFSVRLPLINTQAIEQSDGELLNHSAASNPLNGLQILIVDDEADSLDLLTFVLEQKGAIVTPVRSANAAIQAFNQSSFNLIISDIGMPEVNGYTLMTQIRQLPQGQTVPAIALTAYAGEVDKQRAIDCGFQKHIAKPIDIAEFLTTIGQLI